MNFHDSEISGFIWNRDLKNLTVLLENNVNKKIIFCDVEGFNIKNFSYQNVVLSINFDVHCEISDIKFIVMNIFTLGGGLILSEQNITKIVSKISSNEYRIVEFLMSFGENFFIILGPDGGFTVK